MSTELRIPTPEQRRTATPLLRALPDPVDVAGAPDMVTACSVCLRVWNGSEWIEAEQTIRMLRSFDRSKPPRLRSALCRPCVAALRARHGRPPLPSAA
jgi:hypothetical protein